ncbi:MAG TPA: hypothetical protein VGD30_01470 [Telluria sp.]
MHYDIPFDATGAYAALSFITLLAASLAWILTRKQGRRAALKNSAIAAALVLPFTLGIASTLSHNALTINEKNLSVRAAYFYDYARNIDDFDLARAQFGTYQSIADGQLKWRRNGLGLPGMNAGRYSTTRGKVLFALLTDRSSVLYLPAKTGPSLLVSLENPAAVLAVLEQRASAHAGI